MDLIHVRRVVKSLSNAPHTFQRRVKHEAAEPHEKIAKICNFKDHVVSMLPAALDAFICEVHEHKIRQSVDDLGGVVCGIIVLLASVQKSCPFSLPFIPLHTIG
jgi:hypothetical protein